ncbi:MAG: uncharacterized protein HW386_731 [Gammaproteobacteria bacterium]|nr:uncharacterized protein [Gammaproteobacteria bacterium]
MLSYFELNELLTNVEAEICAAECHGFLCGQICVSGYPHEELWQEFIDAQTGDTEVVHDCYRDITVLLDDIIYNIQSSDFDFQLLLPADDKSFMERVDALADWCHGFLNGYGLGAGEQALTLTEECREILEDFAKICRVDIEEEGNDEDEQALLELIEYVRMGAIIIYTDFAGGTDMLDKSEVIH